MIDPRLSFDAHTLVCQRHEWALAADLTVNSIGVPLFILQAAMDDDRTIEAAQAGVEGDLERAGAFLASVAPVCEWLPPEVVAECWQKAREMGVRRAD